MAEYILALDEGTTSARSCLVDRTGKISAISQKEFGQIFPKPAWVEHNPEEIWQAQHKTILELLTKKPKIVALGITNQRETTIVWNRKTGQPVYNAIVWQDRRTAEYCSSLKAAGWESKIKQKTGLPIDAYFSGTKVAWILDHVSGARSAAEKGELCFGTIDSWLIWKLTGGASHLIEISNASRTMLFNIHKLDWDEEILEHLKIPKSILPKVVASSGTVAEVTAVAELKGLPISGIAGDQQAALFGQTCFSSGLAKNTYGTGCFLLAHAGSKPISSKHGLITTIAWSIGDKTEYALEGSVFVGGAVVQWLRDGLGIIKSSSEIEALALSVPDTGDVYFVPAFAGLGTPHWDQFARGTMVGITRGTTKAHIARAALEAIAFQVCDLVQALNADSPAKLAELRVDGGAANNNFLMQLQADLLQVPIVRPTNTESTALGAAYLAGLGVGFWKSAAELKGIWKTERKFDPQCTRELAENRLARWQEAVERSKNWVMR